MVSLKILICDDEIQYLNDLRVHVLEYMKNRFIEPEITAVTNPSQIMDGNASFDLAFLDIQMEGIDGITLAKELKKRNSKTALFFITNYDEYQDDAMDLQAFRYFSKPFNVSRLYSGLDKAMEYIDGAYVDIFLHGDNAQQRILIDDILYITRANRKNFIKTKDQYIPIREGFDEVCEKMPPLFFFQVHKSYFVNLHYVTQYSYTELYLTDGTRIPIATRKQALFHKYWFEYLRRR